jgi:signal transduction histidine kinase
VTTSHPAPEGHGRKQRERLAELIRRRDRDIQQRWIEQATQALKGREVSPTELRNSMPEYLNRLADGLQQATNVQSGGSSSWENVAREHAETRVRLGFDIGQLVREFIILRQVIFQIIEEEEGQALEIRQAARLADVMDGAIEAAVKSYVESRDYEARRKEAEHVGFITHELRNPLTTAILGAHQLRYLAPLSSEQSAMLAIVERNQHRLADLIDGVLLVERDFHELKPQRIVTTLAQIFEQPVAAATLAAAAKGLHFEARFDPEVVVHVDPRLTVSALDNVLQNAVKYTDSGDVDVTVDDDPNEVVVHVRDSCPGISKDDLRTIFEPFRRASSQKPGAGLGLAIARRAVEVQGGQIHAESGEERGCHFWLTLPKPHH